MRRMARFLVVLLAGVALLAYLGSHRGPEDHAPLVRG